MGLEIRKAKPEEMDEFKAVAMSALMMTTPDYLGSDLTLCAFQDGKLVTSYAAWNLTTVVNGNDIPLAGVTMVGTHPTFRRLGSLRKVTRRHFELMHEEGRQPISALYASRAAIYRRYGYSPVVTGCSYTVEPRYLHFIAGKEPGGSFREANESDIPLLSSMYDDFIAGKTGYLRRSEESWKRKFAPPQPSGDQHNRRPFHIIYEENGKPQGYMFYIASLIPEGRNRWSQNIFLNDVIWSTPSAYRAIWEYFSRMDVIIEITWGQAPEDDPLPHLLQEPRMLNRSTRDGMLARIVDVRKALDKRFYDAEGTLIFKISDDMGPWNEGTWKLDVSPDGSSVQTSGETPQLEMPLSTLSLLFFGQISATEAYRMGRLDANDPQSLPLWDRIMKTDYRPACFDHF